MSYIQNGGSGGGGSGTVTNTGGALTANAVVLGAGGNDEKVTTAFTTDGAATMTVGVAGGGNGVLALSGNTSGTATFTAPATAGTRTNPVVATNCLQLPNGASNLPALVFAADAGTGIAVSGAGVMNLVNGGSQLFTFNGASFRTASNGVFGFNGNSNNSTGAADTGISRNGAAVIAFGNGTAANGTALLQSGMTVFVTSNFTTSGSGTALEAITGLSITVPAVAANWKFHAHLSYSQAVGNAAVAFGIQAVTNNPTNIFANGIQQITVGPPATIVTGTLATLATTTATTIVSGTPGATGTNYVCELSGTCELAASANTIRLSVSTGTAADLVTVLRGSYFSFCP